MLFKWEPKMLNNWHRGFIVVEAESVDVARVRAIAKLKSLIPKPSETPKGALCDYPFSKEYYDQKIWIMEQDMSQPPEILWDCVYVDGWE